VALPSNVQYGQVTGTFINAVADGDDADPYPDAQPATGTITFTPTVTRIINNDGTSPVTILPKPITAQIKDGILVDSQDRPALTLVANKNTTGQNPVEWQYNVQYSINGATLPSFPLSLEPDEIVDLAEVSPIPTAPGIVVIVSDESRVAAEAAAVRAEAAAEAAEAAGVTAEYVNSQIEAALTAALADVVRSDGTITHIVSKTETEMSNLTPDPTTHYDVVSD
jgi:hypothetical protein